MLGKDRTFGMNATLIFQMTFHTGYCETVLFDSWKVSSVGGLIGSMIGIFIMAALYEGLKYYRYNQYIYIYILASLMHCSGVRPSQLDTQYSCFREYLLWKTYNSLQYRAVTMPAEKAIGVEESRIVQ
jgi:copper transporter 1